MDAQSQSEQLSLNKKFPKWLLLLLGLVILVLAGEGAYYFHLKKLKKPAFKISGTAQKNIPTRVLSQTELSITPKLSPEDITVENEYSSLEITVDKNKLASFLTEENVLPGKNCHLLGKDKDNCFSNEKLKIVFSIKPVTDGKRIKLETGGSVSFISQEGGDKELLILYSFSDFETADKILLEEYTNRALLDILLYASYDKDEGAKSILDIREKFDQKWSAIKKTGNYFLEME